MGDEPCSLKLEPLKIVTMTDLLAETPISMINPTKHKFDTHAAEGVGLDTQAAEGVGDDVGSV